MAHRRIIEGVPKVAFAPIHDGKFEFTPFPSCLKSVLSFLGDEYPYHYLLSTCGGAFRLLWHSTRWEGGNVDIIFLDEDPLKPFRKALESTGYSYEMIFNRNLQWDSAVMDITARDTYLADVLSDDREHFRKSIVRSIEAGKPVIAFGVVGPPEASIITGYDEGGDVLIGWSMFQEHMDPVHDIDGDDMNGPAGYEENGYFRQIDWFDKLTGIIVLGEKGEVDTQAIYQDTLEWIPKIIRTPMVHEFHAGLKAYDTYIEKMSDTEGFPTKDRTALAERKLVHYDAMTMIAERESGAQFLADIAENPDFQSAKDDLLKASEALSDANKQMHGWWEVVGQIWDDEEAQVKAVGDPAVRLKFIPYIEKARDKDREAAEFIESVLEVLNK
ncbi:MAG: hypothetical protein HN368_05180 [Spirochaetales bacterium]|jgi:hypothetical protein|nr:hypothetical protein [Spirochaetales bacterium]